MTENKSIEIDGNAISLDELINVYKKAQTKKSADSKAEIKRKNEQASKASSVRSIHENPRVVGRTGS